VEQKGSAVHSKYLRFDFSHFAKLTPQELSDVENFVNARIEGKLALNENRSQSMQEALDEGAIALFGEKYGDTVRTVRFGQSVELCGGTHVNNTGDIWHFKIRSESAIASGIRRIEAITYDAVKDFYYENNKALSEIKGLLNNTKDPIKAINELQAHNADLKKQIEGLLMAKAKNIREDLLEELSDLDGILFLARELDLDAGAIKDLSFQLGKEHDNLFLLFATRHNGKALLSCYVSKPLVAERGLDAGRIVKELGSYIQGGGGGQPFYATAGGKNPEGIQQALEKGRDYIV
jgi:alanyl-tRNA synthetase